MSDTRAKPITFGCKSHPLPDVETVRDRFAMAALTGLLANSESASAGFEPMPSYVARDGNAKWLADTCYTVADAMMEARNKK